MFGARGSRFAARGLAVRGWRFADRSSCILLCELRAASRELGLGERLLEVREQIAGVLETDRDARHARRHTGMGELLLGVAPLRCEHGQAAEALDSAKAGGPFDDLQAVEESRGPIVASSEIEADHPAKAGHLALRDGVIGVRHEARVVDPRYASPLLELAGHGQRARVLPPHPHRQRLEPPAERVRGVRIQDGPDELPGLEELLDELLRPCQRPGGDIAVAVEILRGAVHHDVDAERQRLLIDGARERVVEDRQNAVRAARGGHRRDVDAAERRIDRRLEPHESGRRRKDRVRLAEVVESIRTVV